MRKGYNAQRWLTTVIETRRRSVGNDGAFGALLTDFSGAFHCFSNELFIASLNLMLTDSISTL